MYGDVVGTMRSERIVRLIRRETGSVLFLVAALSNRADLIYVPPIYRAHELIASGVFARPQWRARHEGTQILRLESKPFRRVHALVSRAVKADQANGLPVELGPRFQPNDLPLTLDFAVDIVASPYRASHRPPFELESGLPK